MTGIRVLLAGLALSGVWLWVGDGERVLGPLVIVVGAEGEGLSRLVRETCDEVASIPIAATTESLNASVAASIALYAASQAAQRA